MDPPCPDDETDSGFQQFIWDQFDRIQHDFEEFTKGIQPNVEDLRDTDFSNINGDISGLPQVTNHQFPNLLEDFDEFEKTMLPPYEIEDFDEFEKTMLPPYEINPTNSQDFSEWNCGGENQESSNKVTQNGTEEEGQFLREDTDDSSTNMNIESWTNHGGTSGDSRVGNPFPTLANVTTCRDAGGGGGGDHGSGGEGGVVRSFMKCGFFVQCYDKVNVWRWMGGKTRETAKTPQKWKRKNRWVKETKALAALRLQRQKINNKATAARSFEQKQVTSQQLQTIIVTLLP